MIGRPHQMARRVLNKQTIMKRRVICGVLLGWLCGIHAFCATLPRIAGQWPGIPAGGVSDLNLVGNTLFANIFGNNAVIDITDSSHPRRVGTIRTPDYPRVTTAGPYLVERNNSWIRLLDVSERTSPVEIVRLEGNFTAPIVAWPFLYTLRLADQMMVIYDLTNPRQPVAIESQAGAKLTPLQISGDRLVTRDGGAANSTLVFLDISNRTNPVRGGPYWSDGTLVMRGNLAFFFRGVGTVRTVDITDVANPKFLAESTYGTGRALVSAHAVGNYVWISSSNHGIDIVDMADPMQPTIVGSIPGFSCFLRGQKGNDLFCADHKGITVFDVTNPAAPTVKGEIETQPFCGEAQAIGEKVMLHDWYGPARLFDVTNAVRPTIVAQLRPSYASHVIGDKLFLRDAEGFLDVYNASDLQHVEELSRLKLDDLGFTLASEGDRLFVSCSNTIKVVNFSNPKAMVVENSVSLPTAWNIRMARTGERLVVSANFGESYLSVVDIADASRPTVISTVTNSAYFGEVAANGNAVYVCGAGQLFMFEIDAAGSLQERGWLDIRVSDVAVSGNKLAALASDELRVYDVSTRFAPKLLGGLIEMPVNMARVMILGDYAYIAAGSEGLITVQLAGEPPTQPYLDIINEGEMHRIRWTADFAYPFMVRQGALHGSWVFQPTFNDTKMFIEATAANEGEMQFYQLFK
jgi:hypothetical protein